jgi:oligopeptide/dipeptide ABC transporter ATP-binding protein
MRIGYWDDVAMTGWPAWETEIVDVRSADLAWQERGEKERQRDIGFACLFITHDLSVVEFLADEIPVMYLGQLVEQGSREKIFARPSYPYTQALLAAAPVADPPGHRSRTLVLLGADIPSAMDPPSGCRFHTRCPLAFDRCAAEVPPLLDIAGGTVAFHLVAPDGRGPDVRWADSTGSPA